MNKYNRTITIIKKENGKETMKSLNVSDLVLKIKPYDIVKYLKNKGWEEYKSKKDYIKIFQKKENKCNSRNFYQVTIPFDKELSDYEEAMLEAIEEISLCENNPMEQLLLNFSKREEQNI